MTFIAPLGGGGIPYSRVPYGGAWRVRLVGMTQTTLLLLVVAATGFYSSRAMLRLARLPNELPLKTLLATALAAAVALGAFTTPLSEAFLIAALVLGPVYVFAPLVLVGLARSRLSGVTKALTHTLYWTPEGRGAVGRLLAGVALQRGDAERALALLGDGPTADLLKVQAYALLGDWHEVLTFVPPETGDNRFLAMAARAQAFLELEQPGRAEDELMRMERDWHGSGEGPLGYRAVTLTRARLSAHYGDFETTRETLRNPLPGVPPYIVLTTLAEAAARSGRSQVAGKLYAQAYPYAPEGQKEALRERLEAYGEPLPEPTRTKNRNLATLSLLVVIAACYGLQLWLDSRFGGSAGTATAAFLHGVSGVPERDALWRYLSYAFVHGNLVHVGFNLWVLFDLGKLYETRRNPGNLLAAFVVGSVMGAYFTVIAGAGGVAVVGASAGVLGVAGALLADTLRSRAPSDLLLRRALLQWIVLIALFSLLPGVSLLGHAGGLVGGLLWGFVRQGLPTSRALDTVAGSVSVLLILSALVNAGMWAVRYL